MSPSYQNSDVARVPELDTTTHSGTCSSGGNNAFDGRKTRGQTAVHTATTPARAATTPAQRLAWPKPRTTKTVTRNTHAAAPSTAAKTSTIFPERLTAHSYHSLRQSAVMRDKTAETG